MKKYIQLTAGRGPVECARAVTLVARELLKDFPDAELVESEPHNTEPDCYMSMLFLAETDAAKEKEFKPLPSRIFAQELVCRSGVYRTRYTS